MDQLDRISFPLDGTRNEKDEQEAKEVHWGAQGAEVRVYPRGFSQKGLWSKCANYILTNAGRVFVGLPPHRRCFHSRFGVCPPLLSTKNFFSSDHMNLFMRSLVMENQIIQLKTRNKYYNERIVINQGMDKGSLKALIAKLTLEESGTQPVAERLDRLKWLGFHHATQFGTSLSIEDLVDAVCKRVADSGCRI